MAKLATSQIADLVGNVHLKILENHSIDKNDEVLCTAPEPSWMDPIIKYLKHGELPNDPISARKVKRQAPHYILIEEKLYKRSHYSPLLKCLTPTEADYAMREVHEGVCGNHSEAGLYHIRYFGRDIIGQPCKKRPSNIQKDATLANVMLQSNDNRQPS